MVEQGEDMRDVLVHGLLSGDYGTGYPGIDPSRHDLTSGDSIAPSLGVWAILNVVVDSTRPCPTGALVRVLIRLDQAQELGKGRPASKELDEACLSGAPQLKIGWGLALGHHVGCRQATRVVAGISTGD